MKTDNFFKHSIGINKYLKWAYLYSLVSLPFWFNLYFGFRNNENPELYQVYFSGLGYRSALFLAMTCLAHAFSIAVNYAKSSSEDLPD